jgi:hypothetical protein
MNIYFSQRTSTCLLNFLEKFNGIEVLCPVNVCYTVPIAVFLSDNRPIFYDVDMMTGMGTLEFIKNKVTQNCKVIIYVFQYGNVIDIEEVRNYAITNNIYLVLDYASCFITKENIPTMNDNELCLLSFGYRKQLELGYGGALIVNNSLSFECIGEVISLSDYLKANVLLEEYIKKNFVIDIDEIRNSKLSNAFLGKISDEHILKVKKFFYSNQKYSKKIADHKLRIDNIYTKNIKINNHVMFYPHCSQYPRWRFNILSDKRDFILSKVLSSKWFPPVNERFGDNEEYPGARRHSEIILNLFNDRSVSIFTASKISRIINKASIK